MLYLLIWSLIVSKRFQNQKNKIDKDKLMSHDWVKSKVDNGVFEIQLNRADKMNALTDSMYGSLVEKLIRAENDSEIKIVLLRSSSAHFSAGNDLADFLETEFNEQSNVVQFLLTLARMKKTIIAAVNGAAVGIGTTMLLHCDLVYAAKDAKFSVPFIKLGLTPEGGSSQLMAQRCGALNANDWLLTGRNVFADEACRAGLVNQVFDDAETLWSEVAKAAQKMSRSSMDVLLQSKQLLKGEQVDSIVKLIKKEAVYFAKRLESDEAKTAFDAFLNR